MLNSIRFTMAGALVGAVLAAASGSAAAAPPPVSCVAGQAPAPAALTKAPTGISDAGATLQGSVNPNGCSTMYHFEYGPTTTYGTSTPDTAAGVGTSFVSATAAITGLKPNTTYHFKIVATSVGGMIDGADGTLTTEPGCAAGMPATVVTGAASKLGPTSATVAATVNPHGCPTMYEFQYGATTGYGKVTSFRSAGSGTTPTSVSAGLSGLIPNTVYHFRILATNAGGTIEGTDMSFQTPAGCVHGVTAPSPVTGTASSVTMTTAVLNGSVGPNDCPTTYYFQYGLSTSYGKATPHHTAGSGTSTVPVATLIGGLTQGTLYHYRLVATSTGGTRYGADMTLVTTTPPPARIRIDGRRPAVRGGFFVAIHLHCTHGASDCSGTVSLFRDGRPLGRQGYVIAPGTSSVVFVKLNGRGRRLVRHHRLLRRVEVVATSSSNTALRFVTLRRTFRP